MAGPHQIWKMPLDETEIGPYAGNGREDIVDGPLLPQAAVRRQGFASFAQPSGLATDGKWLYVADSEGQLDPRRAVRSRRGSAKRVVGPAPAAGCSPSATSTAKGDDVRLQHPLGVAYARRQALRGRHLQQQDQDPTRSGRSCRTIAGTGQPGRGDGDGAKGTFYEPAGSGRRRQALRGRHEQSC